MGNGASFTRACSCQDAHGSRQRTGYFALLVVQAAEDAILK
jgi:hypothetical protein